MAQLEDVSHTSPKQLAMLDECGSHQINLMAHSDALSDEGEMRMYEIPIGMGMSRRVQYTPNISTTKIIDKRKAATN